MHRLLLKVNYRLLLKVEKDNKRIHDERVPVSSLSSLPLEKDNLQNSLRDFSEEMPFAE